MSDWYETDGVEMYSNMMRLKCGHHTKETRASCEHASYMLFGTACMAHGQEDNEQPHPCILTCTSQDHLNYETKCQNLPRSHSQGIGLHTLCRLDCQRACPSRRGPGKADTLHSEHAGTHVQELNDSSCAILYANIHKNK